MIGAKDAVDARALPGVIREVVELFASRGVALREIGNGWCEDFADEVLDRWIGVDWRHREGQGFQTVETANFFRARDGEASEWGPAIWDWTLLERHWGMRESVDEQRRSTLAAVALHEPTHIWITVDGRHYDAESPEGVGDFHELGFFRRWIEAVAAHDGNDGNK